MKTTNVFWVLSGCMALLLGLSILGCGNTENVSTTPDYSASASVCNDGCNTIWTCNEELDPTLLSGIFEEMEVEECVAGCEDPDNPQGLLARQCIADQCDISSDCATFMNCLCNCGLPVLNECT